MPKRFILALDQGTTSSTALVIDDELTICGRHTVELPQYFPQPGWVEHDLEEIWQTTMAAAGQAMIDAGITAGTQHAPRF